MPHTHLPRLSFVEVAGDHIRYLGWITAGGVTLVTRSNDPSKPGRVRNHHAPIASNTLLHLRMTAHGLEEI